MNCAQLLKFFSIFRLPIVEQLWHNLSSIHAESASDDQNVYATWNEKGGSIAHTDGTSSWLRGFRYLSSPYFLAFPEHIPLSVSRQRLSLSRTRVRIYIKQLLRMLRRLIISRRFCFCFLLRNEQ